MRLSLAILLTSAFLPSTFAAVVNPRAPALSFNPPPDQVHPLPARRALAVPVPRWSTGQADPSAQRQKKDVRVPSRLQPRKPKPSGKPLQTVTGHLAVTDVTTGASLGYIGAVPNIFGEYNITTDLATALSVTVTPGKTHDLSAVNGFAKFPLIGGISGFANADPDLGVGSFHYSYIGGVSQTLTLSPPFVAPSSFNSATGVSGAAESAIWSYDSNSRNVTAQWVNTDGSLPKTYLIYVEALPNTLALTGDPAAFASYFQLVTHVVTLTLVQ